MFISIDSCVYCFLYFSFLLVSPASHAWSLFFCLNKCPLVRSAVCEFSQLLFAWKCVYCFQSLNAAAPKRGLNLGRGNFHCPRASPREGLHWEWLAANTPSSIGPREGAWRTHAARQCPPQNPQAGPIQNLHICIDREDNGNPFRSLSTWREWDPARAGGACCLRTRGRGFESDDGGTPKAMHMSCREFSEMKKVSFPKFKIQKRTWKKQWSLLRTFWKIRWENWQHRTKSWRKWKSIQRR